MALIATSGMTLFSWILARIYKEKFLETVLLNQLIFPRQKEKKKHHWAGIGIHYAVGYFFSYMYSLLWARTPVSSHLVTGSILGAFNGIAGISGWHTVLVVHPDPPRIRPVKYYMQLLAAHVVFGALNALVYNYSGEKGSLFSAKRKTRP